MLAFKNRFHGHGSLKYVYRNGASVRSRLFAIKYVKNTRRTTPRVAIVVSKKVLKPAVGRNRIRRRLYEIIRQELPQLIPEYDIAVIVFSRDVETIPHEELETAVIESLRQARLYK